MGWANLKECKLIFYDVWKSSHITSGEALQSGIKACLMSLRKWNYNQLQGSLRRAITRKKKEIARMDDGICPFSALTWTKENLELEELVEEDERYWKQRSREDWLNWGHQNSKCFF